MKHPWKIAFSHDWLNGMRGGEKCLESLCQIYPSADIFTLFAEPEKLSAEIRRHRCRTSFIHHAPFVRQHYRYYLPLFPQGVESFRLKGYDAVISLSHCVSKGIRPNPEAVHICYCFTPMRYAWVFFNEYFGKQNTLKRGIARQVLEGLKRWDLAVNRRVDRFVAISSHVQKRIRDFYDREADVIYPPVETNFYTPDPTVKREDFYLVVSALVPYKRIDTAVRIFKKIKKRLVVIGEGPERGHLESLASPHIKFFGWQRDEVLRDYYRRARALIFPGEEDFGIVPLEMQACGGAVIALAKGGALETLRAEKTGIFFQDPTEEALIDAIHRFEKITILAEACRTNAERFSKVRYVREMETVIEDSIRAKKAAE